MRYGVVGLGPVGAIFAAVLGQQKHQVSVLCRNPTRAEYFRHTPLKLSGKIQAEWQAEHIHTSLDSFLADKPEILLICTKASQTVDLMRSIKAMGVSDATTFVSCQNGIDSEQQIADVFGAQRTLRMVLNLGCNFVKVHEVWVEFCFQHVLSANADSSGADQRICNDFVRAGLKVELRRDYKEDVFRKAILNTALSTACALTRLTMRQAMTDPEIERMVREIVRESLLVAEAIGFPQLDRSYLGSAIAYLKQGGDHKPSMLVDIEANRNTENEFHAGAVFRYAQKYQINVPVIQTLYYLTKNLEKSVVLNRYVSEGMRGNDV